MVEGKNCSEESGNKIGCAGQEGRRIKLEKIEWSGRIIKEKRNKKVGQTKLGRRGQIEDK